VLGATERHAVELMSETGGGAAPVYQVGTVTSLQNVIGIALRHI
jgi:hypothetical protein